MIAKDRDFLKSYVAQTPLALAFERSLECRIMGAQSFARPILDIGCGDGLFAHILFDEMLDTGIDPNPTELDHARKLGCYSELIECRGDAIPQADGRYRTIFSNSVLEHIPDLKPVLTEALRLLAPGGMLYLTVPTDRFEHGSVISRLLAAVGWHEMDRRFRAFYNRFWVHHHCYPPQQWAALIADAGFQVRTVRTYDPLNVCTLNDLLAPLGFPGLILKRFTNSWVLSPSLRRLIFTPALPIVRWLLRDADQCKDGGLVFIAASKP